MRDRCLTADILCAEKDHSGLIRDDASSDALHQTEQTQILVSF